MWFLCSVGKMMGYRQSHHSSIHSLHPLFQHILLRYLSNLRTLDLGFESSHFIMDWNITPVRAPLTHLRIALHCYVPTIWLPSWRHHHCLRHYDLWMWNYVTLNEIWVSEMKIAFCMSSFQTFTFVKSLYGQFADERTLIDALTTSAVMSMLQRTNLIVTIDVADLHRIDRSAPSSMDRRETNHQSVRTNCSRLVKHQIGKSSNMKDSSRKDELLNEE